MHVHVNKRAPSNVREAGGASQRLEQREGENGVRAEAQVGGHPAVEERHGALLPQQPQQHGGEGVCGVGAGHDLGRVPQYAVRHGTPEAGTRTAYV